MRGNLPEEDGVEHRVGPQPWLADGAADGADAGPEEDQQPFAAAEVPFAAEPPFADEPPFAAGPSYTDEPSYTDQTSYTDQPSYTPAAYTDEPPFADDSAYAAAPAYPAQPAHPAGPSAKPGSLVPSTRMETQQKPVPGGARRCRAAAALSGPTAVPGSEAARARPRGQAQAIVSRTVQDRCR